MDSSGTFWYNGDRGTKADALMKRLPLILLSLTTLACGKEHGGTIPTL